MSTLITNQPVAPNRMRGRVRICLDGIRPAFGSDLAAHLHPSHLISVQPNGGDQQLATVGLSTPQDVRARLLHRLVRLLLHLPAVVPPDDPTPAHRVFAQRDDKA
jgi:hypothetical protein